jgi:D-serine deaminase-like pyridoxal phosphate-dependent protein
MQRNATRRTFLAGSWAVGAGLSAPGARSAYTSQEIEKMLARGDIQGRLTRHDLPTPVLCVDLDAFEHNVEKMAAHVRHSGKALRPHGKTHKCPEIARRLIRAGAAGACVAKLSEAEVFAREGVKGLLVTTAVIGTHKVERAVRLAARHPNTIFSADDPGNLRELNDAAGRAGIRLQVAIDLWIGGRTGAPPGEPALGVAELTQKLPHLRLAGLQAYCGPASHRVGFQERRAFSREAMLEAVETRRLLESKGIACPLLSGGSTGTYNIDSELEGVTELQPGSYIFMDIDYNRIGGADGAVYRDFRNSLFVITTVVSKPQPDLAVVDGGLKAFSTDKPFPPEARGREGITFAWGGDEHGRLTLEGAARALSVGDRIEFVIPHCDPTVNLYNRLYALRGDRVEDAWPVSARGMSQ